MTTVAIKGCCILEKTTTKTNQIAVFCMELDYTYIKAHEHEKNTSFHNRKSSEPKRTTPKEVVAALQDERNSLVSENEIMKDRPEQLDDSLDDPNTAVTKKCFHAQL
ncbi:uncharacterized protein LOC135580105 isoform X4 [Columba livia]|uniref:uncharacterized protein LOC135580105 isoform X4 n=1 Tax=Columba livia TaxID=8932 RepID=UPI0031BBC2BA